MRRGELLMSDTACSTGIWVLHDLRAPCVEAGVSGEVGRGRSDVRPRDEQLRSCIVQGAAVAPELLERKLASWPRG
eukprot:1698085-Prymnesium_polylepis.1